MPKNKAKKDTSPEPENVGKCSRGASHKLRCMNLWEEEEIIWCLKEYNRQSVKLYYGIHNLDIKANFIKQKIKTN